MNKQSHWLLLYSSSPKSNCICAKLFSTSAKKAASSGCPTANLELNTVTKKKMQYGQQILKHWAENYLGK